MSLQLLKELLTNFTYEEEDIFLSDALWAIQRKEMPEHGEGIPMK
jgi:hypothetical protein